MNRTILFVITAAFVAAFGCHGPVIGDRFEFWKRDGDVYFIEDVPANRERGNISRVALYWVSSSSRNVPENQVRVWELIAERPIPFAGFKFQPFHTPPGFKLVKDDTQSLPTEGYYYLDVYGYPAGTVLLGDLPSPDTVLGWKQKTKNLR